MEIEEMLLNLNIDSSSAGFKYMAYGIKILILDRGFYEGAVEKRLYPAIAKKFNKSVAGIKYSIKYSLDKSGSHKSISRFMFDVAKRLE